MKRKKKWYRKECAEEEEKNGEVVYHYLKLVNSSKINSRHEFKLKKKIEEGKKEEIINLEK